MRESVKGKTKEVASNLKATNTDKMAHTNTQFPVFTKNFQRCTQHPGAPFWGEFSEARKTWQNFEIWLKSFFFGRRTVCCRQTRRKTWFPECLWSVAKLECTPNQQVVELQPLKILSTENYRRKSVSKLWFRVGSHDFSRIFGVFETFHFSTQTTHVIMRTSTYFLFFGHLGLGFVACVR